MPMSNSTPTSPRLTSTSHSSLDRSYLSGTSNRNSIDAANNAYASTNATNMNELPLETFQQVIKELATNHGVVEAWKLRGVCRQFCATITTEVFHNQPRSAFQCDHQDCDKWGGLILLHKGLHYYLDYQSRRASKNMDAPILASLISEATDIILKFEGLLNEDLSTATKDTIRTRVAYSIANFIQIQYKSPALLGEDEYPLGMPLLESDHYPIEWLEDLLDGYDAYPLQWALCVAILWADQYLLAFLVWLGADIWAVNCLFKSPLYVAFQGSHAQTVKSVLARARPDCVPRERRAQIVKKTMFDLLKVEKRLSPEVKKELVRWCLRHIGTMDTYHQQTLCYWAIELGDIYAIESLVQCASSEKYQALSECLAMAYFYTIPKPEVLAILAHAQVLHMDRYTSIENDNIRYHPMVIGLHHYPTPRRFRGFHRHRGGGRPETSVLDHALLHCQPAVVRLALELGCPPDGICLPYPLTWELLDPHISPHPSADHIVEHRQLPPIDPSAWEPCKQILKYFGSDPNGTAIRRSKRIKKQREAKEA
ncbi:hypothetical protein M011DRAFT_112132 [Sporormia fimetaria CBS 119925]|uniref:Uncharacterized protein n=1 Tax=Sporormia fimetaria CBS 119925 TaxID=1340428 RepID=A0A6A6VNQ7_9PLEO|nr:hypothetical protein M011DRAFT_112132 [Sporormia fimetaria CBS 119925]